jgi:RNA polymerase sigma factor (sigma-70 family)
MRQLKITKQVTNRDTPSLDKYLQEIGKVDLISPEEEVPLARKIRNGDKDALAKLVKANLRFVVSVAKQYQNQGMTLPDLINEGNLGLMKAAQRFDETRGFKFISYAVWWIRQSILQALAEQSRIVRLPVNKIGCLNRINKAFARLEQEYEREPSAQELAIQLEMAPEEVKEALQDKWAGLSVWMLQSILRMIIQCMMCYRALTVPVPTKLLLMNRLHMKLKGLWELFRQGKPGCSSYISVLGMKHPLPLKR